MDSRLWIRPYGFATHWSDDNAPNQLTVSQVLIDPADQNDWEATFTIDLAASRAENRVVLRFDEVKPIG